MKTSPAFFSHLSSGCTYLERETDDRHTCAIGKMAR